MNVDEVIDTFKHYIKHDMYTQIQDYYDEILTHKAEYRINYEYVFQKVYLFACIKRKEEVVKFMFDIYKTMSLLDRIGLRPTIIYGKYLYKDGYPVTLPKDPKDY